jgi:hypothetical protein
MPIMSSRGVLQMSLVFVQKRISLPNSQRCEAGLQEGSRRMNTASIVSKVWGFCTTRRDDGVSYGDYLEQLTYLIFLKMADEYAKLPGPYRSTTKNYAVGPRRPTVSLPLKMEFFVSRRPCYAFRATLARYARQNS